VFTAALVGAEIDIEHACGLMLVVGLEPLRVKVPGMTDEVQDAAGDAVQLGCVDTVTLIGVDEPPARFRPLITPPAGLTIVTPDGGESVIDVIGGPAAGALFVSVMPTCADDDPAGTAEFPVRL
jgi:hypothetical protein